MFNTAVEKDKLAKRLSLNDFFEYRIFPKYIMIETIDVCNAKCIMCNVSNNKSNRQFISDELFDNIINQLKPYANWIEMVLLYGRGEPLIDKDLENKVGKLKSIGIKKIQVSTNASLLTKDRAFKLFKNGLNDLRISIDSIVEDTYSKIRVGLCLKDVLKNINDTIQVRNDYFPEMPIKIRLVEMPENKNELQDWMTYWTERIGEHDTAEIRQYAAKTAGKINESAGNYPCVSVFSTLTVRSNGIVNLCCGDLTGSMNLGNLNENSILDIWHSEQFESIRNLHLEGKRNKISLCNGCDIWGNNE